jgi:hypothetical protein
MISTSVKPAFLLDLMMFMYCKCGVNLIRGGFI